MKILVVHRQKTTVEAIQSVLNRCKPVVRYADSGLDGLLTSRIEHFDLIICGTDLPVITGFELIRSIRTNSINRTTPVFFLTEEGDEKARQLGNALGVSAVLTVEEIPERLSGLVDVSVKSSKTV
jgi:CheY-like chemotaxis protein